jgi:hypothetical protein
MWDTAAVGRLAGVFSAGEAACSLKNGAERKKTAAVCRTWVALRRSQSHPVAPKKIKVSAVISGFRLAASKP